MQFNDYQKQQGAFAKYPDRVGIVYPILGLFSEASELSAKLLTIVHKVQEKDINNPAPSRTSAILADTLAYMEQTGYDIDGEDKRIRDTQLSESDLSFTEEANKALKGLADKKPILKELGDQLWMISDIARHLGVTLEEVAQMNLDKLNKRVRTDTIGGSGDTREETVTTAVRTELSVGEK